MAVTPCLKDFFDDEILNAIETEKRIEPVQQPKYFFDDEILNAIEPVQQPFSMTTIPVMEAENIFEPEKVQVELPVCEPENSHCLDDNELELFVEKRLLHWFNTFFCLNGVEYFVVKKSFGCCTGSIRFSVSMVLSISSSKKSFRQGIVKI